jgi:hypothetical protein
MPASDSRADKAARAHVLAEAAAGYSTVEGSRGTRGEKSCDSHLPMIVSVPRSRLHR